MAVVDIDRPETWPQQIVAFVESWATRVAGSTSCVSDLRFPLEVGDEFRKLFAGLGLMADHATRLLPHEREMVERDGLRPLTQELVEGKIRAAIAAGCLTASDGDFLRSRNVFAQGNAIGREGQVCLMLSDRILRDASTALGGLLTYWGGEAMFTSSNQVRPLLSRLGTPTLVVANLDVERFGHRHSFFPALHNCFVGSYLGLDATADIFFRSVISPTAVIRISQPGGS